MNVLKSKDVINAKNVLVQVNADNQYPMFIELKSDQRKRLENIDNDSTARVTNFVFEDSHGEIFDFNKPDPKGYHLVIGPIKPKRV